MSDLPSLTDLLSHAETIAIEAGKLTLQHFGSLVDAETKGDGTPVTIADRGAEELLRERISDRFPDHGILGEEYAEKIGVAPVRWILDPIDGTKSFMHGVPLFGVLIGIEVHEEAAVGVVHFPALNEIVSAARGEGCRWNGKPCQVSEVDRLEDAIILTTDERRIRGSALGPGWVELTERASFARGWGDCYGHALVATGRAEAMIDPRLTAWDAGPLLTIVTEAGGEFLSTDGHRTIHGGSGVSTNAALSDEVRQVLREAMPGE